VIEVVTTNLPEEAQASGSSGGERGKGMAINREGHGRSFSEDL